MTNLDSLHNFYLEPENQNKRQSGKTFAACYDVIGAIQLSKKTNIICLIKKFRDIEYIQPMLFNIFSENGLRVEGLKKSLTKQLDYIKVVDEKKREFGVYFIVDSPNVFIGYDGFWVSFIDY